MSKANNLTDFLTDLANTIRGKDGTSATINPQDFSTRIVNYQNKTITPSASQQSITRDSGYMALGTVTINAMPGGTATSQDRTSGGTGIGYGKEVSLTAGYYTARIYYNSIGAGTIDVTDLTITPNALSGTWDSTNNKYIVSQASKTATMQSTVTTAGYVSSTVGTKNTGTATVSAPTNLEIAKATFTVDGASVKTTSTGAGYIPASTTVGTVASGSATTPTESGASTSTSLSGTTLTVARSVTPTVVAGYISSGTSGTVTITGTVPTETKSASGSGDVTPSSGKLLSKVTVGAGSATPNASYATLSSAGSSPTSVTSQYFKITPTASVGTAGWISSISKVNVRC